MTKSIFVAGHNGMVGSAIIRKLKKLDNINIIVKSRNELDLTCQQQVQNFFKKHAFDEVYIAAAKVGGIHANNSYPADFLYENLMIQSNLISSCFVTKVKKVLFLGSSCIYPKMAKQPIKENELLSGFLEPTNEPYAIAKIAGIKLCESFNRQYGTDFRTLMPTNLYGPNDNFGSINSHVVPALINRIHIAKQASKKKVEIWGSGKPRRELLHVDDLADASIFFMSLKKSELNKLGLSSSHINVGSGLDYTIKEIANLISSIIGFSGDLEFDTSMPDGTPQKLLDIRKMTNFGWKSQINLEQGIKKTYEWYKKNV